MSPEDIQDVDDLKKLPILDKATIRRRFADLQSKDWPKKRIRHGYTGGTTGTALKLAFDVNTQPRQWAVWWRHRERFGLKLSDPFIVFAGRDVVPLSNLSPPVWRRNFPMHQTYISVHHLTEKNMPFVADYLCGRRVAYYAGYPSALYLVACYFLAKSIRLPYPPKFVVTGAESLLPHQRKIIARAFGTVVTDQYGASEQCGNISECEYHKYHIDMEFGIVELLPISGFPSSVRRIICTGFCNPAMPFIRYDIEDIATISEEKCECGRQSPIVEKIDGRIESYILTPDGRQLGRLDFLFKKTVRIEEVQLVQNAVSSVTVKIVRSPGYCPADEKSLLGNLTRYLGDQITIKLAYVEHIPRGRNGKFRQIISHVFRDRYRYSQKINSSPI